MAYMRYKELTKYFHFSRGVDEKTLPEYVSNYLYDNEIILDSYKTLRDFGVFTNQKLILFDCPFSFLILGKKKEITIVPYKSISTCSIIFRPGHAELCLMFDSGYPLRLKFRNMRSKEKARLRKLYYCISKIVANQEVAQEDIINLREAIKATKIDGEGK